MSIIERVVERSKVASPLSDPEAAWLRKEVAECFKRLQYVEKFAARAKGMRFKNPGLDQDVKMHVKYLQKRLDTLYSDLLEFDTHIAQHEA